MQSVIVHIMYYINTRVVRFKSIYHVCVGKMQCMLHIFLVHYVVIQEISLLAVMIPFMLAQLTVWWSNLLRRQDNICVQKCMGQLNSSPLIASTSLGHIYKWSQMTLKILWFLVLLLFNSNSYMGTCLLQVQCAPRPPNWGGGYNPPTEAPSLGRREGAGGVSLGTEWYRQRDIYSSILTEIMAL